MQKPSEFSTAMSIGDLYDYAINLQKENEELRDEVGKWLSHVIKLDDKLGVLNDLLMEISSGYKRSEDDIEVSCLIGEILDRPEVKAMIEKDKV